MIWTTRQAHSQIRHSLDQAGVTFDDDAAASMEPLDRHQCPQCPKSFDTPQGVSAHLWQAHHTMSLERRYVYGPTCVICGRCYWTSQRMQQHLRYSRKFPDGCLAQLVAQIDPLSEPVEVRMPDIFRGLHRLPCTNAEGPIAMMPEPVWKRAHEAARSDWQHRWLHYEMPLSVPDDVLTHMVAGFTQDTCDWITHDDPSSIDDLVYLWLQRLESENVDRGHALWSFFYWGQNRMYDLFDEVENPDLVVATESNFCDLVEAFPEWTLWNQRSKLLAAAVPPSLPDLRLPAPVRDCRTFTPLEPFPDGLASQTSFMAEALGGALCDWPIARGVPVIHRRDGTKCMLFLHMFSGRRRDRDCHYWLQALSAEYLPGIQCYLLSADTAVHPEDGNLSIGPALTSLLRLARAGAFTMSLTGPPCETWTEARHIPPPSEECRFWPRPLRLADQPWGLHGLASRELAQLAQGSALMLTSLGVELHILLGGGGSIMEHPAPPFDAAHASVWATPLHRNILDRHPSGQRLQIAQWKFGAKAIKPTMLRYLGLPPMAATLYAQYNEAHERPDTHLGGWDYEAKGIP